MVTVFMRGATVFNEASRELQWVNTTNGKRRFPGCQVETAPGRLSHWENRALAWGFVRYTPLPVAPGSVPRTVYDMLSARQRGAVDVVEHWLDGIVPVQNSERWFEDLGHQLFESVDLQEGPLLDG